ncbi:MAG TPA: hypothetical protein VGO37_06085 [Steroidobacteraceae bacterium]|jgi:hypothetical protein|nr:hypothetical protein [Steroidobacteraceae bacterium]
MSIDNRLERIEQARAARKRPRNPRAEADMEACIRARFAGCELRAEAYAGLSVPEKIAEKRLELAETIADWAARDPSAFGVNTELVHTLRRRQLELDIEELEGASADTVESARTAANEAFRFRGRPQPEPAIIERNTVVATIGVPTVQPDHREPPRRPKFDRLADYRADPRVQFWEPSQT